MSWYLTFNEDLPNWATYFMVFVSPDEPSNLRNTGPMDEEHEELGLYSTALPRDQADAFLRTVERSGYSTLVVGGTIPPETPTITIGKGERTLEAPPKLHGFDLPRMPMALIPVREALHDLARELRRSPLHVVRGKATWAAPAFKPKGVIEVILTLNNPGPKPVEIVSPDSEAALVFLTIGKTSGALESDQVQLSASDITRVDPVTHKKMPPSDLVTLGPGEEARFKLKKKVYLTAGGYRGTVTLRTPDESAGPGRAYGVLLAKAGGFDVKGWW